MAINLQFHHRGSIRLKGYDYSQPGGYFVTLCTHRRECILGDIVDDNIQLNQFGEIVREEWLRTEQIRPEITMDEFMVMPNHLHGIIMINPNISVGAHGCAPMHGGIPTQACPPTQNDAFQDGAHVSAPLRREPKTLGSIIAGFKSIVTHRINSLQKTPLTPIWQRNYYEHIIRDEDDLNRIRQYILDNPIKWEEDENNPNHWKK